jgi:hypothetical protein
MDGYKVTLINHTIVDRPSYVYHYTIDNIVYIIYDYTKIIPVVVRRRLSVCVYVRVRVRAGGDRNDSTRTKKFSLSASLNLGCYNRQPTDTAGCGPSRD